jgi:Rps23 Pro-64 3,4-dihydroxylase Tpa1-like proline 4-hydroxylase
MVLINDIDYDITKVIASTVMEKSDFFKGQPEILGKDVDEHCSGILQYGYNMMFYRWSPLSYIPVHTDNGIFNAATIYLNRDYDIREGGVYMYKINEEDLWTGIEPKFNRMVVVQGDVPHWSTPVTSDRNRMSIQMFSDMADGY